MMEEAGQKLKRVRERLQLKYREVEEATAKIAAIHDNDEYTVALSRLSDIENKGTLPSIYRLYSLCAVYRLDIHEVLRWYGISLSSMPGDSGVVSMDRTHSVGFQASEDFEEQVQIPIALDPGIDLTQTVFMSRMIQKWGKIPLMLLKHIDLRDFRYAFIGTGDWTMHPLIPPGSLVVINDEMRRVRNSGWRTEFERPIYFMEHRDGYICSWCNLRDGRLIVQPHPASGCESETYAYPDEIEVLGQVTHVAMSLDPGLRRLKTEYRGVPCSLVEANPRIPARFVLNSESVPLRIENSLLAP